MIGPDEFVVVEVAATEPEAELLCSLLRSADIGCLARLTNSGAGAGDGLGTAGAHEIMVVTELPESVDGCEECLKTGENWSWCFADEIGMVIPKVHGHTRLPASPLGWV